MDGAPSNYGFNSYAAGTKRYGAGRDMPNIGPSDPLGYKERDLRTRARNNAILRRLQALQSGNTMSANYLRSPSSAGFP